MKRKAIFLILGAICVVGLTSSQLLNSTKDKKDIHELTPYQIRINVTNVSDKSFTGIILEQGSENLVNYPDEIVFHYDTVPDMSVGDWLILDIPELPIMTMSIPPQMPNTQIHSIIYPEEQANYLTKDQS